MATKLSFKFPFPLEKSSRPSERISLLALPQLNSGHGFCLSRKYSGFRGLSVNAIQEEVIQSTNSETTLHSQTTLPSSSKLVLVVGATGGVGM
ncbi:hypothetical protein CCACVL1_24591 [Corchorus capsularis]|uniref:Uncharacterized protein n=1 Tax=Corchorus capsularis TaxID=210143 RepID=A0A1R3GNY9_COCAP|nr:hypothetical protein CCACVL1_24591 [Corchorus capsularis]